jgi:ribosomal protein RSM22 (predicted rRNA methylase)
VELPVALRQAVETVLEGVPLAELARAAADLSSRYRAERRDGAMHLAGDLAARAYLATRLPATYAAIRACLDAVAEIRPDFAPRRLLDLGAGPGTALWAVVDRWPSLEEALQVEASPVMRAWGERLSATLAAGCRVAWRAGDIESGLADAEPHDLLVMAYVLGELMPDRQGAVVDRLWELTTDLLLIVEPGTPAGWRRILAARERLLARGAHMLAPCPHAGPCPLAAPDWCHFAQRLPRSRLHRLAKAADVPWEDEKFIYLAVARAPAALPAARVIAPPRRGKGHASLKLCLGEARAEVRLVSRRDGESYKRARRTDWGDIWFDGEESASC